MADTKEVKLNIWIINPAEVVDKLKPQYDADVVEIGGWADDYHEQNKHLFVGVVTLTQTIDIKAATILALQELDEKEQKLKAAYDEGIAKLENDRGKLTALTWDGNNE